MFTLNLKSRFLGKEAKLVKKKPHLKKAISKAINLLETNPFYPSLKSHKVVTKDGKTNFSSSVTGDIRIIWRFSKEGAEIIDITDIGGHSGKDKVYK